MTNPMRHVFEYHGQRTAERYNQFFNPNLCHVCKSSNRGNLISCDQCCLVFYCSEEHRTEHHSEHEESCWIILWILQVRPKKDTHKFGSWQEWIESRKSLMELIECNVRRPLKSYEKQMILWTKSCFVCHRQTELQTCQRCFSVNYCDKHANDFRTKHNYGECDRLVLSLNIDIETISGKMSTLSYDFLKSARKRGHFAEMLEFCLEYLVMQRADEDWLAEDYVQSDHLSGPLTVYSGLERINSLGILRNTDVVIHVIAANSTDRDSLAAWEILLHLVTELQNLTIVMIGPKLTYEYGEYGLCELCKDTNSALDFFSVPMLYHDFVRSSRECREPNIIVGFHAELNKGETWSESIKVMQSQSCPLLLTSSCGRKLQNDIIKIQKTLNISRNPFFKGRNLFGGLAPHRDLDTGDTYFRNEHFIFFDDLDDNEFNSSTLTHD